LFDNLQQVLRLATECPPGPSGDELRRAACQLTEASSMRQRRVYRQRMLKTIARIQARHARGRHRTDDPSPMLLMQLSVALCRELHPDPEPDA
jgi:hypothetical protein